MLTRFATLGLSLTLLGPSLASTTAPAATSRPSPTPAAFQDAMRKLWEDHVVWTRLFIISAAHGLPDKDVTTARLLQNQTDIGNAIKPFYGDAAGNQLTALLRSHIITAAELVGAAKSGDTAAVRRASTHWYANGDSIATFLAGANPANWPLDAMKGALRTHLFHTLEEAKARLGGDYKAEIVAYDTGREHMLQVADILSSGIIAQFPRKFT